MSYLNNNYPQRTPCRLWNTPTIIIFHNISLILQEDILQGVTSLCYSIQPKPWKKLTLLCKSFDIDLFLADVNTLLCLSRYVIWNSWTYSYPISGWNPSNIGHLKMRYRQLARLVPVRGNLNLGKIDLEKQTSTFPINQYDFFPRPTLDWVKPIPLHIVEHIFLLLSFTPSISYLP